MAFSLRDQNLTGLSVITNPGGLIPTAATFTTLYDYAMKYQPELIPELHYANGKGRIMSLMSIIGNEGSYASDKIQHAEFQRLHNKIKNVAVTGNNFTCPVAHNLRPNMIVIVSDGVKEIKVYVDSVTSSTVFVGLNTKAGAYNFAGNVDIVADFSNTWDKGTGTFVKGRVWDTKIYENYSQIIKEVYEINESDMAHATWIETPDGPMWYNKELEATNALFDNIVELTFIFGERIEAASAAGLAGKPLGMKGVVQQVEERGNVGNDYIQTLANLRSIAARIKKQSSDYPREYIFYCDNTQMNYFQDLCGTVSPSNVGVTNFGNFENKEGMGLFLEFDFIKVSGIKFHFVDWEVLNDPTLLSDGKFDTTGVCYLGIPMGKTKIQDPDTTENTVKPYLSFRFRRKGVVDRKRRVKIFGLTGGQEQSIDSMRYELITECTNQLVGANLFFVGRRSATFYTQP